MSTTHLLSRQLDSVEIPFEKIPTTLATAVIIIFAIFIILSWTTVFLRFMTRLYLVKLGWDDWFILLTAMIYTVYCSFVIAMELIAFNKGSAPSKVITHVTNLLLATECLYILGMTTLKISLGFFFYRLIPEGKQRKALIGVILISTAMGIAYFFWGLWQCGTPGVGDSFWIKRLTLRCKREPSGAIWGYVHAVVNTVTDIVLSTLPIPLVWRAKIKRKDKIVVSSILILANITSVASIVRFGYIHTLGDTGLDFFIHIHPIAIISAVELGVGIIAASMATLRPLLRKAKQVVTTYKSKSTSRSGFSSSDDRKRSKFDPETGATTLTANSAPMTGNNVNFLLSATKMGKTIQTVDYEEDDPSMASVFYPTSPISPDTLDYPSPLGQIPTSPQLLYPLQANPARLHNTTFDLYQHGIANEQNYEDDLGSAQQVDPGWRQLRRATWWNVPPSSPQVSSLQEISTEGATQGSTGLANTDSNPLPPAEAVLHEGNRRWVIDRLVS